MTIRTKLTFYFILITASVLFLSFYAIYFMSFKERENYFYQRLLNKSIVFSKVYFKINDVDTNLMEYFKPDKNELLGFENISFYRADKKEKYSYNKNQNKTLNINIIDKIFNKLENENEYNILVDKLYVVGKKVYHNHKKYFIISTSFDEYGIRYYTHFKRNLAIIYFNILIILFLSGWFYSKRALNPITKVMKDVESWSVKNFKARLIEDENQKDEIGILIKTFNRMLNRIESVFIIQKGFISNVSHELMNPLSAITAQIEVALLSERKNEEYKKTLESILEDIRRLNVISNQIINLSKYNENQNQKNFNKIRLDEVIWDTRKEYLKFNKEVNINFRMENLPENDQSLYINGNETLLKTCFQNLIDNGCKYSTNKKVNITLSIKNKNLIVVFENDGLGINSDEYNNLFIPFFRSSNSSNIKGNGIGLSIVKSILDIHNTEITVTSLPNKTTNFKLFFNID